MPPRSYIHPDDQVSFLKRMPLAIKVLWVGILIILPIAVLWLVLTLFVMSSKSTIHRRPLPATFSDRELYQFTEQLALDPEYRFYFTVFHDQAFRSLIHELYEVINDARTQTQLRQVVMAQQKKINELAAILKEKDFPEDFSASPLSYPQWVAHVWNFIFEEYKLAILGVIYQSRYDKGFFFVWSNDTQQVAYRVRLAVERMTQAQKVQVEQFFLKARDPGPDKRSSGEKTKAVY